MSKAIKEFIAVAIDGKWSWGWGQYIGKPQLEFVNIWYDGQHYCLHIGPFWVEIDE